MDGRTACSPTSQKTEFSAGRHRAQARPSGITNYPMQTNEPKGLENPDVQESLVDDLAERMAQSFTLGYDAEDWTHHYYAPADSVVIYDDRELDRVQYLDGRPLWKYVEWIEEKRGWRGLGSHARNGIVKDAERKESDEQ